MVTGRPGIADKTARIPSAYSKEEVQKLHDAIEKSGDALETFINEQKSKVRKNVQEQFSDFLTKKLS